MSCTACTWACTPPGTMRSRARGAGWRACSRAGRARRCVTCAQGSSGRSAASRRPWSTLSSCASTVRGPGSVSPCPQPAPARCLQPQADPGHLGPPPARRSQRRSHPAPGGERDLRGGVSRALRGVRHPRRHGARQRPPWPRRARARHRPSPPRQRRHPQWRRRHLPAARLRLHRTAGERRLRGIRTRLPLAAVQARRRDRRTHGRPRDRLDDARRDRTLRELDYTVLRFTDADVYQRPRSILAALTGGAGLSQR